MRTRQLAQVLADTRGDGEPTIIAGDFNNAVAFQSFMFEGLGARSFIDALGPVQERQTSINHRHPIDWIFVKGAQAAKGRVHRIDGASDHYPLVVTLTPPVSGRATAPTAQGGSALRSSSGRR